MPTAVDQETRLTDQQVRALLNEKVFFGHQSVGNDIIEGIRDLMVDDTRLKLNIIGSRNPETVSGPALVEAHIGENTKPQTKNEDFLAIMNQGFAGIALVKYCYVDIGGTTDVRQMFNSYQAMIEQMRKDHPRVRIVHVTVPLTAIDSSPKAWLKGLLGRNAAQDDNLKRNQFNALLRQTYAKEPIFDLAAVESTHADGSRVSVRNANDIIYTLASEYTTDGGHLNQTGRRITAQRLLEVLAAVH